jgi:hypothetical protein
MVQRPVLSALMCDGMGWFTSTDFKRALLLFDRIAYLIPEKTVEFEDSDGTRRWMMFPPHLRKIPSISVEHYVPDHATRSLIAAAADADVRDTRFRGHVETIVNDERRYTWQVVNADGDLGAGTSLGLSPDEEVRAHALLLNKFLVAADALNSIPITGKPYIHPLIATKYERTRRFVEENERGPTARLSARLLSSMQPVALAVAATFIPDAELERRSEEEIAEYRERHRDLFAEFSSELIELAASIRQAPGTSEFREAVEELVLTKVEQKRNAIADDVRAAWNSFFKTSGRALAAGVVGLGVAPLLPLAALVTTAAAAAAPWLVPDLIDLLAKYRKARRHGLYYLLGYN